MKKWYQSRKFWVAIVAGIVAGLNRYYGWAVDPAEIMAIISPFLLWIGVEGAIDAKRVW